MFYSQSFVNIAVHPPALVDRSDEATDSQEEEEEEEVEEEEVEEEEVEEDDSPEEDFPSDMDPSSDYNPEEEDNNDDDSDRCTVSNIIIVPAGPYCSRRTTFKRGLWNGLHMCYVCVVVVGVVNIVNLAVGHRCYIH